MQRLVPLVSLGLLVSPLCAQLIGNYSINPAWPPVASNFDSFASACAALASQGVVGPVTFEVYDDAGPFTESSPITPTGLWAPDNAVVVFSSWNGTSSTNRVTFRPAPGEAPVIEAAGKAIGIYWGGADYVTVEGLEIRNAIFDAISLYSDATLGVPFDPIIRKCRIHDCGGVGVSVYGNSSFPVNTLIENNFFWGLLTSGTGSFNTTGRFAYVTSRRSTNTRVVHNTFFVNTGQGSTFAVIGAYPAGTTEIPFGEVSNNVVYKTAAAGKPILRIQSPTGATNLVPTICESNCFFDSTTSPFAQWGVNAATTSNTLIDWQTTCVRDLTSLAQNPNLRSTTTFDLHLAANSPCLGASTVSAGTLDDIDGQLRTTGIDLGADEFSAASIASVGNGCPGTGSLSPVIWSNGWPYLGNPNWPLLARNLPANAPMFTFVSFGTTTTPFPVGSGCNVWLPLTYLTALPVVAVAGQAGTTSILFDWPAVAAYAGLNYGFQAMVIDNGAPLGITLSNALDVVLNF